MFHKNLPSELAQDVASARTGPATSQGRKGLGRPGTAFLPSINRVRRLGRRARNPTQQELHPKVALNLNLGGYVELLGYDVERNTDGKLFMTFYWKALASTPVPYSVFIHFSRGPNQPGVFHHHHWTIYDSFLTTRWRSPVTDFGPYPFLHTNRVSSHFELEGPMSSSSSG